VGLYIYIIKKFSIKQLMNYQCILYFVTSTSLSLLFIGIPVSRALSSVGMGLVLFTWLVSGDYQGKWQRIRDNPLSLPVFLLWLLTFVASLWSVGDWATIEKQFLSMCGCYGFSSSLAWFKARSTKSGRGGLFVQAAPLML